MTHVLWALYTIIELLLTCHNSLLVIPTVGRDLIGSAISLLVKRSTPLPFSYRVFLRLPKIPPCGRDDKVRGWR